MSEITGLWRPANHGTGRYIWFLCREAPTLDERYHESSAGFLIRYKSFASAQHAADRLNTIPSP